MDRLDPGAIHPALPDLVQELAMLGAKKIILYGSRARVDNMPRADIDLAVEGVLMQTPLWSDMLEAVDNAKTLLEIDLVSLDEAAGHFRDQVLKDGKILYEQG